MHVYNLIIFSLSLILFYREMVELRTVNEKFWFKQSLSDELLQNVRLLIQNVSIITCNI